MTELIVDRIVLSTHLMTPEIFSIECIQAMTQLGEAVDKTGRFLDITSIEQSDELAPTVFLAGPLSEFNGMMSVTFNFPIEPGSFAIVPVGKAHEETVIVYGADVQGLVLAMNELSHRIAHGASNAELFSPTHAIVKRPET